MPNYKKPPFKIEDNRIPQEAFWDQKDSRFFAILAEPCVKDLDNEDENENEESDEEEDEQYEDIFGTKKNAQRLQLITFFFSAEHGIKE